MAVKTDFWKAVKAGDRAGVESLLAAEPGLATARLDGASAILVAMYYRKPDVAECDGKTAADHAGARGHEGLAGRLGSEPWS